MSINSSTNISCSSVVWQNPSPEYYSHILNGKHNNYSFSLTDENNEVLNLEGLNCNFTILFYKVDPIIEQRSVIKLAISKEK